MRQVTMNRTFEVTTSWAASVLRGGAGLRVGARARRQPEKPLELYEFEACPFCRKVREGLSMMDLDAMIFPCPKEGLRYRPKVLERGGVMQFPYLVDVNTGREMYESDDILRYLAETYGASVPLALSLGPLTDLSSALASVARVGRGRRSIPSRAPDKPLELWSFEASPYCRLVREALSNLELPYLLHNVAKSSAKREAFVARSGRMMVPYLHDPNTDTSMFESADIVRYLLRTYALS
jgi:glutathione S-transferase